MKNIQLIGTKLQHHRAAIFCEAVKAAGTCYLTPKQGVALLHATGIKDPRSLSRELSRINQRGLDTGNIKPPYAAMAKLMNGQHTPEPPVELEPIRTGKRWQRNYMKRRDDEGDPENGTCPRCQRLWGTRTYLTVDGDTKYCAACAWEPEWADYLPIEVT